MSELARKDLLPLTDDFIGKHLVYLFHDTINDLYYIGSKKSYNYGYLGSPKCSNVNNKKYNLQKKYLNSCKNPENIKRYVLETIEVYDRNLIESIEKKYQLEYDVINNEKFINASIATIRRHSTNKGFKHTKEAKRKISKAIKGRKHKSSSIEKMKLKRSLRENQPMSGKSHKASFKEKMKTHHINGVKFFHGNTHSKESRDKISQNLSGENSYMYGKEKSKDTKSKISNSMKGRLPWNCKITINETTEFAKHWASYFNVNLQDLISFLELEKINYIKL